MSRPEEKENQMNEPSKCTRKCHFRGEAKCGFESCPFDEYPMNKGEKVLDKCEICEKPIMRGQLCNTPTICDTCKERLKFLIVDNWDVTKCLVETGGFMGYCK